LPLMLEYYLRKRHAMFRLIKQIEVKSSSQDDLIEKLIKFMLLHQRSHSDELEIDVNEFNNLAWLDDQWFQFVTNLKSRRSLNQIQTINKRKFELSIFKFIIDEINCADAYVLNSYDHDDPNKQFISWEEFYQNLTPYTELIGKPKDPQLFVEHLQIEHQEAAEKTNKNFIKNEYLSIVNSEPVLKRVVSQQISQPRQDFSNLVASKMPLTDIISVFLEVENWLNLSHKLKPLSGYESKIKDYALRFIATWFAYGCNVGPVQAERCLKKYSRKQIAWLFNHHITEVRLNKISEAIRSE
ncbi:Tn3 family transposase, partial [Brucella sp. 10RB9210]|nr:Tn3 family transposase [Brucella sp. 10RB9210]